MQTAAAVFAADPALAEEPEALANAAGQGHESFVRLILRYQPDLPRRVTFPAWSVGAKTHALNELLFQHGRDASQPDSALGQEHASRIRHQQHRHTVFGSQHPSQPFGGLPAPLRRLIHLALILEIHCQIVHGEQRITALGALRPLVSQRRRPSNLSRLFLLVVGLLFCLRLLLLILIPDDCL